MFANGLSPDRRRIAVNLFVAMLLIGAVALGLGYRLALAQLEGSGQPWLIILPMAISLLVAMLMLARHLARLITSSPVKVPDRECLPADQTRVDEENQRALYLRATLDNLPFLFWLKDTQSRFLAVNKRFADACGKPSPESVVGLSDFDVWPAELAELYCADDRLVMNSGQEKSVEEPVAGGSEAGWIETFKKPVRAEDGTILGTVGFARDISERIFMQRALLESEERWALAVKGANDGIWDWNPKKGTVYFSNRWKSMLGYAPDELGDAFAEWHGRIHPDDLTRVDAALARHLNGAEAFYQCEYRLRCKGGAYTWVSDRGQAQFDAAGQPLRMAGSLTDVTSRRETEARIRDRNQQLNAIFDLSPDGFVSFDAEHRVKYASPAFLRMTGIEEGELGNLDEAGFDRWLANLCVEPAIFPGLAALRTQALAPGKELRQLIELAGPGKQVLEVRLRLADSETVSQILYLRDITHESEVDRIKSEFLSTAAHELRTPMASIYGFTELLLQTDLDPEDQQDFLQTIYQQSELMIAIVNELLDLSRIEARRGKDFRIERINLCELLDDVVAAFMPPDHRPLPLKALCLPDEAFWIKGDRNKLRQALGNVLSNAYKYSPDGGPVALELTRTAVEENSPRRIGIRISDHGIGMNAMQLARVCERFYRADTSGKIPGTGLGMSIVKEIIELHHGELALESQPRQGTAVTLWLPAMDIDGELA
ncbi:MAG: PAS domain S-box protein [Rhodocyclaceae bacterium]|nr:PAS domain S-box protein [Rhodocyclaceae bacterium]